MDYSCQSADLEMKSYLELSGQAKVITRVHKGGRKEAEEKEPEMAMGEGQPDIADFEDGGRGP